MRDNSICVYSFTYNILSHLSISGDMISIAIDNSGNNTVGGCYFSAHQAVLKFTEHINDMVSYVHRKCQIRSGVSGDVDKMLECVTITDNEVSNRVLER